MSGEVESKVSQYYRDGASSASAEEDVAELLFKYNRDSTLVCKFYSRNGVP